MTPVEPSRTPAILPLRVADRVAAALVQEGCRFAFGVPGGEVLTLLDALTQAGIAFVAARHENAAGFMAEGTHHVDGAPGILLATLGPGVANAVNVAANALQDAVPLVILSGRVARERGARYRHQIIDHQALFRPVVKGVFEMVSGNVDAVMSAALDCALRQGAPGPVLIDVPTDVADEVPGQALVRNARPSPSVPAKGDEYAAAMDALASARRPLLIAGLGAMSPRVPEVLLEFVERTGAPVLTSYKAKGLLNESHRLALGGAGLSPRADEVLLPLVRAADVVVLLGYEPIEMRDPWIDPFGADARIIEIVTTPPVHRAHAATWLFEGDLAATLDQITQSLPRHRLTWDGGEVTKVQRTLASRFAPEAAFGPGQVIAALRATLPDDVRVTVDTGAHRILMSQQWKCAAPRTLLQSTAFCTMGCALPMAIGVALASPGAPVVAVVGDGGLEMVLGELATLRDAKVPVVVVVLDDQSYALIEMKQRSRGLTNVGVDLGATDFAAVARAMGGAGVRVVDVPSLTASLTESLASPGFSVIHCMIGKGAYDGRI